MKKILLVFLFIPGCLLCQQALKQGNWQVNAGAGFSNRGIPIYGGVDYAFHKDMTVGAEGALNFYDKSTYLGAIGNWNYHFNDLLNLTNDWDVYAGVNVGIYLGLNNIVPAGFMGGIQLGGRYYINDQLGLNFQVGGSNIYGSGRFGVSIRL